MILFQSVLLCSDAGDAEEAQQQQTCTATTSLQLLLRYSNGTHKRDIPRHRDMPSLFRAPRTKVSLLFSVCVCVCVCVCVHHTWPWRPGVCRSREGETDKSMQVSIKEQQQQKKGNK